MGDRKEPTPCPETAVKPAAPPAPPQKMYLEHAIEGEIRDGELHWKHGWFFERMFDGTVKIRFNRGDVGQATAMIPRDEWDAIAQHVAPAGSSKETDGTD